MSNDEKINAARFYFEYKGHTIPDITAFHKTTVTTRLGAPIVYLAGDSSLDNKFWVSWHSSAADEPSVSIPKIYKDALNRPRPRPDVAFWLNHFLGERATAINTAVEASLLRERDKQKLLVQDQFIRDHIESKDVVIVSVGSNDIAMKPTLSTILHMLLLAWLTPLSSIQNGTAWGLQYFRKLFKSRVEEYVTKLVEKNKPRAVIVCMIYFPLEAQAAKQKGWADVPLRALGYNGSPGRLQTAIQKMYELGTEKIQIPGVRVIPMALYEVMDGKNADDYVERVEPSVEGGRKMATRLAHEIEQLLGDEDEDREESREQQD